MKLIVIGSNSNSHIRLNSQFVSGYHAELLLLDNGEILLTDKGSKNGTYINDQRLQPNKDIPIKRGDSVRFADQVLDWRNVPALPMPDFSKIKEMRGIGTNFRNKHQLQGERVSRFHATLTKKSDKNWYIQDHSKNGTTVNGKAIPSNQDIKLKKGDKILCAGVPVPNPCGEGKPINYRKVITILSIILLLCGGSYGIYKIFDNPISIKQPILQDSQIYDKYKNSVVLLHGAYFYKVTAGKHSNILEKLEELGVFSTEYIKVNIKGQEVIVPRKDDFKNEAIYYTGTGFYISEDAQIATNLHIARPWLFDDETINKIETSCKLEINNMASEIPDLNIIISEIKVEGVLINIGMVPNGAYFSGENLRLCREVVGHNNVEKDVAILQLETKKLPNENCNIVDLSQAVVQDSEIQVGSHIYTMGFPFGLSLQDLKSSKGIQLFGQGGSITRECSEYSFSFNAPSYHGASGSPIFNERGQLIGVLNSGVDKSQGFNGAIKASHVIDLLNNNISQSNN